ncbi:MAG TPA: efflux RND transporter periplasmic adaptor subunit [Vicinamibacterales bacterium]|nr:efflux RND transporter periplasmic adaptor subunit [Vicinamibacterales bacterium]
MIGVLLGAAMTVSCATEAEKAPGDAVPAVQIGAENIVTVSAGTVVVGPIVSGELTASRESTVRAELGGAVVEVNVDEAQKVERGELMARIETRTLEDAKLSSVSALRSAENQLAVARREAERAASLVEAGAVAARDLDVARNAVTSAEAQVADARSRLASAERALSDTEIRALFAGIVSRRAVHAGDVVSPGTELFRIIDPSSMRLEASVTAEDLPVLRVGATVQFRVRGYERSFQGRIERIAPQADPSTRQVPIYVSIPNPGGELVAGLFAEGRVVSSTAKGVVAPIQAVNTTGPEPWVLRVVGGTTERVSVTLGLRDPRSEQVLIASGLKDGDTLLSGAAQGITPGTPVRVITTK